MVWWRICQPYCTVRPGIDFKGTTYCTTWSWLVNYMCVTLSSFSFSRCCEISCCGTYIYIECIILRLASKFCFMVRRKDQTQCRSYVKYMRSVLCYFMVIQCGFSGSVFRMKNKFIMYYQTHGAGAIFTKTSQVCGHANLLLGCQWTIWCMGPNNISAWSQSCEDFVNMALLRCSLFIGI
jgi:hypothetical protein